MLKSELIAKLTRSLEDHGDGEVCVVDSDCACAIEYGKPVTEVTHNKIHSENYECIIKF